MTNEFSAGGIVFNSQNQVLIINPRGSKNWTFPKGHLDEQSLEEAALREVREETGIEAKIIQKIGDSEYVYTGKDKNKIFKVVTFFLMEYISGNVKDHDGEVTEAKWIAIEDVMKCLSFKNDKELLQKAVELKNGE